MHALSNTEIEDCFWNKKANKPLSSFGGVFMSNELDYLKEPQQGKQYIINMANSDDINEDGSVGTHWVLISNLLDSSIIYMDPFGTLPNKHCLKFLKKAYCYRRNQDIPKRIIYNTSQIQGLDSEACGYFCVYVAKQLLKHKNFVDIIYNFDQFKPWMNDEIVKNICRNENVSEWRD